MVQVQMRDTMKTLSFSAARGPGLSVEAASFQTMSGAYVAIPAAGPSWQGTPTLVDAVLSGHPYCVFAAEVLLLQYVELQGEPCPDFFVGPELPSTLRLPPAISAMSSTSASAVPVTQPYTSHLSLQQPPMQQQQMTHQDQNQQQHMLQQQLIQQKEEEIQLQKEQLDKLNKQLDEQQKLERQRFDRDHQMSCPPIMPMAQTSLPLSNAVRDRHQQQHMEEMISSRSPPHVPGKRALPYAHAAPPMQGGPHAPIDMRGPSGFRYPPRESIGHGAGYGTSRMSVVVTPVTLPNVVPADSMVGHAPYPPGLDARHSYTVRMVIPQPLVGVIVGKSGRTIADMQRISGTKLNFNHQKTMKKKDESNVSTSIAEAKVVNSTNGENKVDDNDEANNEDNNENNDEVNNEDNDEDREEDKDEEKGEDKDEDKDEEKDEEKGEDEDKDEDKNEDRDEEKDVYHDEVVDSENKNEEIEALDTEQEVEQVKEPEGLIDDSNNGEGVGNDVKTLEASTVTGQEETCTLTIVGRRNNVNVACLMVLERMEHCYAESRHSQRPLQGMDPSKPFPPLLRLLVPTAHAGRVMGPQGAALKEMMRTTRASINMSKACTAVDGRVIVTIRGSAFDCAAAQLLICDLVELSAEPKDAKERRMRAHRMSVNSRGQSPNFFHQYNGPRPTPLIRPGMSPMRGGSRAHFNNGGGRGDIMCRNSSGFKRSSRRW